MAKVHELNLWMVFSNLVRSLMGTRRIFRYENLRLRMSNNVKISTRSRQMLVIEVFLKLQGWYP